MIFRTQVILIGLMLCVLATVAVACPASYVKAMADQNKGTTLHDKATKIADKYMCDRGMNPSSAAGEIAKPYVIGTALVEHYFAIGYWGTITPARERINLNKDTVDEATQKALGQYAGQRCSASSDASGHGFYPAWHHFNRHFSYGLHVAGETHSSTMTNFGG